jgi:hypothetical protein
MTLLELQAWLGHRSPDTTQLFAEIVAEVLFGMDYTDHTPANYEAFFDAAL